MSGLISASSAGQVSYLKIKGLKKGSTKVYITETKKTENGYEEVGEYKGITGEFKSITFKTFEYDGKTIENFVLTLVNEGVNYVLELNVDSMFGRGILNSLVGYGTIDTVEISVYISSKTGRPTANVLVDGERAQWAISWEDQQNMIEITKNRKGEIVDSDASALINKLKEMAKNVKPSVPFETPANKVGGVAYKEEPAAKASIALEEDDDDSDLPF